MSIADKLKQKAVELDLSTKAALAKEKAGTLADQNRDKIAGAVDKAGQTVNEKTGGKYSHHVAKAQGAALQGVEKVASQRGTTASGQHTGVDGETATQRTVGADGIRTSDDVAGESRVERAVGADATTTSLDPEAGMHRVGENIRPR